MIIKYAGSLCKTFHIKQTLIHSQTFQFVRTFISNMANLSHLPKIEDLSDRIIRVLGCNPGPFTLQGTNCYLIGNGSRRILLDTGIKDQEEFLVNLKSVLDDRNISLQEIIITHWHKDHCGGVPGIFKQILNGKKINVSKFPRIKQPDDELGDGIEYTYVKEGHVFETEGATLRAMYTPGHADDHMCLIMNEDNVVFTGDTVLGEGTAVFEDLHDYMKSLERIRSWKAKKVYPAHGAVVNKPEEHLTMYITHRLMREKQILDALEANKQKALSPLEIVGIVYKGLADNLIGGATNNVNHHLSKLIKDLKVTCIKEDGESKYKLLQSNL